MSLKLYIKRVLRFLVYGIPEKHVTAQISVLAKSDMLKGKTALITGGTSGIGYAISKAFLIAGANVIITGRTDERIKKTCEQLKGITFSPSQRVYGLQLDNCNIPSLKGKFDSIFNWEGITKLDILVNNAGILGGEFNNVTEEEFDKIVDTNLKGTFFLSKLVGQYYKDNNIEGNILNIASSSSLRPATSAYTISKWGIRGLTLGLAKILAPYGVTVNGLAPGPTATPMLSKDENSDIALANSPIGRYVIPDEIADMAVFLVSSMGKTIVGDVIYMTGGAGLITFDDIQYSF